MEWTSLVAIGISILTLTLTRIDKARKDAKEDNLAVIVYQIKELKDDIQKLSDKFDTYEKEEDDKIDKAIQLHEKLYHRKEIGNDN